MDQNRKVLVFGATGNIGGAAARELLKRGWHVRAITRNPTSDKAGDLAARGAELIQADMDDSTSLAAAFDGIERVFSVQNWTICGVDGERRQAMRVAAAAHDAQVKHLVYGSAGEGEPNSGIAHFDGKLESEAYMRSLGLPLTVVRPGPFMELLADKQFLPPLGIWGAGARVMGWDTPSPWIALRDLGVAIANIFEAPERWIGCEVSLFGDVKSLGECRAVFKQIDGKKPFRLPLPLWLFGKMAGDEMLQMWQWLVDRAARRGTHDLWQTVEASRELCPDLLDVSRWLQELRAPA